MCVRLCRRAAVLQAAVRGHTKVLGPLTSLAVMVSGPFCVCVFCATCCRALLDKPDRGESCMRLRPSSCAASCRVQSYQWHMVALASLAVTALVMWYFSGFGAACYRPPLDKPEFAASFVRLCGRAVAFQPAKLTVRDQSTSAKTNLNLPPRSTP